MKLYDFVSRNEQLVKRLIRIGVMSSKVWAAYDVVKAHKQIGDVYETAYRKGISERTVWRYIQLMRENI